MGARFRNFATVVYPESAPPDWLNILSMQLIPVLVSPLHDKDINPDGEVKKPHYHVLYMFEGAKSIEQVRVLIDELHGVGCETVNSIRGYARYLCHLDNPEKFQYNSADVKSFAGADFYNLISLVTDKYKAIAEIIDYCTDNQIISYADLLIYARVMRPDWFRVLCDSGTYVIKEYLKSYAWTVTVSNKGGQPQ